MCGRITAEAEQSFAAQARFIADLEDSTGKMSFKLTPNRFDRDFFRREIQEEGDGNCAPPTVEYESHKLIRQAREFFRKQFADTYEELAGGKEAFS